jgi:hypothetical protein
MGGGMMMEFHPSIDRRGDLYFLYWDFVSQTGDLYVAHPADGKYPAAEMLKDPISTLYNEVRPTIDADGKYLLFESDRPGGLGGTDIYICAKHRDGTWSAPKNLGPEVNTAGDDDVPNISPDGKYWFFMKDGDIYWRKSPHLQDLLGVGLD